MQPHTTECYTFVEVLQYLVGLAPAYPLLMSQDHLREMAVRQQRSGESCIREPQPRTSLVDTARSVTSTPWEKKPAQHRMKRVRVRPPVPFPRRSILIDVLCSSQGGARCEMLLRAYTCSFGLPPQLNASAVQRELHRTPTARPSVIWA